MLTLECLYISKSKKSASFAVKKNHGPVTARIATGFLEINDPDLEVGDTIELEGYDDVDIVESTTDDGQVFNWLTFK